ncbi:serine/threonine protein kinase [Streptomyces sp. NPDC029674]|uniref:serine/threonine protein kinase n=1 Tax=Streptomyces sp. NPDC029674 TaxID=3365297 RepID=UPI00384F3D53
MPKYKVITTGVASTALALGATLGLAGTASAATPSSVCGSGFTVRDSSPLGEGPNARVYLLRNGSTACVVTFKTGSSVGNTVGVGAWVSVPGDRRADQGPYATYAGPVKINASCVSWGGNYGEYTYKKSC